ncbi:DMT family transporter [Thalassovita sp.]|uniref:DMT family transporter n=1 Tax=Thalassovita sp. TaxID=1979401 RepID=UPI0029DE52EF|nr:DMT family transporter [Thalassovita sp.]
MRLILLTTLTMIAFAANSVLNRMGLVQAGMEPVAFGTIRLVSGALVLGVLALVLRGGIALGGRGRVAGVLALLVYIYGFSAAYVTLDAGVGALILFGTVQITMFAGAIAAREPIPLLRWLGAMLAFAGLAWLLWPSGTAGTPVAQAVLMVLAGLGWGVYSLAGRAAGDALQATAANFLIAAPIGFVLGLLLPSGPVAAATPVSAQGVWLAVLSGGVTSGLGYALWYSLLSVLGAGRAAVAQLSVPVIAIGGGLLFLAEVPDLRFLLAAAVVLGGVALSLRAR